MPPKGRGNDLTRETLVAGRVLETLRGHPLGRDAVVLGRVTGEMPGTVWLRSRIGGRRRVDMISGEQLPRIC